ncbi:hypothetical protein LG293_16325 (plasmid) [Citricoccus nitrophenolicus]
MTATATSPAMALIGTIRELMSSGLAHVTAPQAPGIPPVRTGDADHDLSANTALGWVINEPSGEMRAQGVRIGKLVRRSSTGEDIVVLHTTAAFREATRRHPGRLESSEEPYDVWCGVWNEGLTPHGLVRASHEGRPAISHLFQFRPSAGEERITVRGVPVLLSVILGEQESPQG